MHRHVRGVFMFIVVKSITQVPPKTGVNIPGNFSFHNNAVNNHLLPLPDKSAANYAEMKEKFTTQYFEALPAEARANQCMDCEECLPKCPQQIRIPNQLSRIVELLRKCPPPKRLTSKALHALNLVLLSLSKVPKGV